jgi:hypothetical protein
MSSTHRLEQHEAHAAGPDKSVIGSLTSLVDPKTYEAVFNTVKALETPMGLAGAGDLMGQMFANSKPNHSDTCGDPSKMLAGKHHKQEACATDKHSGGFFNGVDMKAAMEGMQKLIKEEEKQQHKIAEKELKKPDVQKVTEKHENGAAVETVTAEHKDGSVETFQPGGTRILQRADGYKETEYPKAINPTVHTVKEFPNGDSITNYRDGSVLFVPKNGEPLKVDPDGTATHYKKDGSKVIEKTDKTVITVKADGSSTTIKPDGTVIDQAPNGDKTVSKPEHIDKDGTRVWHQNDGTEIREKADGTRTSIFPESVNEKVHSITVLPNGDIKQDLRDGSKVSIGHDGISTYNPHDGKTTTIKPDGTVEMQKDGGIAVAYKPDGNIQIEKKNGTVFTIKPDGDVSIHKKDGTEVLVKPDGSRIMHKPSGEMEYTSSSGEQIKFGRNGEIESFGFGDDDSTSVEDMVPSPVINGLKAVESVFNGDW